MIIISKEKLITESVIAVSSEITLGQAAKQQNLEIKKREEKQLYRYFKQQIGKIADEMTRANGLKRKTSREKLNLLVHMTSFCSAIKAEQNDVMWTNHIKAKIDKTEKNSRRIVNFFVVSQIFAPSYTTSGILIYYK